MTVAAAGRALLAACKGEEHGLKSLCPKPALQGSLVPLESHYWNLITGM